MIDSSTWERLSPWAIISYVVKSARELISNGFAIVPLVITGWNAGFDSPWFPVAVIVSLALIVSYALIQWLKFRYRLTLDKLNIRSGALFTTRREVPINKIQNVRLEQPFYYRPLGLCTLVVETAGSKQDEAELAAIPRVQAQQMKRQLLNLAVAPQTENGVALEQALAQEQQVAPDEQPLISKNIKALCLFGLYSNNLIWAAAVIGPLSGAVDWGAWVNLIQDNPWVEAFSHQRFILQILLMTLLLVALALTISGINILATLLKYYPYQLSRTPKNLLRSGGVISHQQDGLPLRRVQILDINQPVIARILGLWTLSFKQVQGQEVEQVVNKDLLAPSLSYAEVNQLIARTFPLAAKDNQLPIRFLPIHSDWLWRRLPLPLLIPLVNSWTLGASPITLSMWIGALVGCVIIWLRYRQWGYRIGTQAVWQHTGVIGQRWRRIPFKKVQSVSMRQTPGQKAKGIASLQLGLASGTVSLPAIPLRHARLIAEKAIKATREDFSNWI